MNKTKVNEVLIEDFKFEGGAASLHFPDRAEDKNSFILDIGSDPSKMGIEAWVTVEGELNSNPDGWNVFQIAVQLRHSYTKSISLADIDNIDKDLGEFPDLLAIAQRALDAILEKHPELR
jgi:hypothetical protein